MPRVDIATAARTLGLSEGAVKKRLQRGTLPGGKDAAGRWYVALDAPETSQDSRDAAGVPSGIPAASQDAPALVAALQSEIDYLRDALTRAQQGEAELRRLLGGSMARPELPEASEATPEPPPQPAPRRPWWRFW